MTLEEKMKTFLEYVAQDLLQRYGNDLSGVAVVFPNKRAALFLNQALARLADKVGDGEGGELPLVNDGGDTALKLSEVVELLYRDLTDTLFDGSGRPRASRSA